MIKTGDHIIDIGPEGGAGGGEILFEGTPEAMVNIQAGFTARYLKEELKSSK